MMRRLSELGYTHEYTDGYSAPDITEVLPGSTWSPRCSSGG